MGFAALIAAAGNSSRMGSPKALMRVDNKHLLMHKARQFLALETIELFVTLPPQLILYQDIVPALPSVTKILNSYAHLGYWGSIKSAIDHCSLSVNGIFITPVDAILDKALLFHMAQLARLNVRQIIVPHYYLSPGHPVYLSRHFFSEMACFSGSLGLRQFIAERKENIHTFLWPNHDILANLNYGA